MRCGSLWSLRRLSITPVTVAVWLYWQWRCRVVRVNEAALRRAQMALSWGDRSRSWYIYVTSHVGQLSFLSSARWEMSTGQRAVAVPGAL